MNVIFLDIDGVMISDRHLVRSTKHTSLEWGPDAVRCLKELIEVTQSKIVVSSTWRRNRTIKDLTEIFSVYDFDKGLIVGKTPVHWDDFYYDRGREIQEYIDAVKGTELEVDKFVIIDDDCKDINPYHRCVIKCSALMGFTDECKDEAILLFLRKNSHWNYDDDGIRWAWHRIKTWFTWNFYKKMEA